MPDALEHDKTLQLALHQVHCRITPACELLPLQTNGRLAVPLMASIDAKSVFEAIRSEDAGKLPLEESSILIVLAIGEDLQHGRLNILWWIDTRDMVADGLNKGGLDRRPLQLACSEGKWFLPHPYESTKGPTSITQA